MLFLALSALGLALAGAVPANSTSYTGTKKVTLDVKLEHAFDQYEAGRAAMLKRVAQENSSYKRNEWEAVLAPASPKFALSDADLAAVKARHNVDVAQAKTKAERESVINLDAVRSKGRVAEFCSLMPRAAILHVHPSGTRDIQTIVELLQELDPVVNGTQILEKANDGVLTKLYENEVRALQALPVQRYSAFGPEGRSTIQKLFFLPSDPQTHDFTRFEALFEIGSVLLKQDESKEVYVEEKTFVDFAKRAAKMGLSYAEFTKVEIPPTRAALNRFAELRDLIYARTNVTVNFNYAFVRTIKPVSLNNGWVKELLQLVEASPEPAMVGIDLLANEVNTSALDTAQGIYMPVLAARQARRISFRSTMHSGELGDVRNVRDAIIMGSTRIGHGVLLQKDVVTLEYARRKRIPTVCSLKSNRLLQVWYDYSVHPFLRYLRLGLPVSLSTDDEGKILNL